MVDLARVHKTLSHLQKELVDQGIVEQLNAVTQALTQAASSPHPSHDEALKRQLEEMLRVTSDSPSNNWVPSERDILEQFEVADITGRALWQRIHSILSKNNLTPTTAASALTELNDSVKKKVKHIAQVLTGLTSLGQTPDTMMPNEVELGVCIPTYDTGEEFDEIEKILRSWSRHLDVLGRALFGEPQKLRVKSIGTGSVQVFLQVGLEYAEQIVTIVGGILGIFQYVSKQKETAKKALQDDFPPEVVASMESHIEATVNSRIAQLQSELTTPRLVPLDPEEQENVRRAIQFIASELNRGAKVEVSVGPSEDEGENVDAPALGRLDELRERSVEISRQLEAPHEPLRLPSPEEPDE